MPKSTEGTVFVRFVPTPSGKVQRHQLEDIFSQIGPIKKSSWIASKSDSSKGYGFVKYLSSADAGAATSNLHDTVIQMEGRDYQMKVESASAQPDQSGKHSQQKASAPVTDTTKVQDSNERDGQEEQDYLKKKSRVILRNLSFYAKESHIRSVLEKNFGKVVDVHLPKVQSNLHVGFCFVTFADPVDALKAVKKKNVDIQKRAVSMDWSVPKRLHQQKGTGSLAHEQLLKTVPIAGEGGKDAANKETNASDEDLAIGNINVDPSIASDKSSHLSDDDDDDVPNPPPSSKQSLHEKRTIFLRNLPFDTTRNDLFEIFAGYGYIESIYLVKDRITGMLKGTAFVTYRRPSGAQKAVDEAAQINSNNDTEAFVSLQKATGTSSGDKRNSGDKEASAIILRGRNIVVNFAVDKETAATFDSKEHNSIAADKRNMYLQSEARVESTPTDANADISNTWDDIPEQDQKKRQTALKDKITKLQSPIFFINPNRLSFRNLAKHIDELQLQKLCESATKRGLQAGLVGAKDHIAHLRARGEMSTREILADVQEKEVKKDDVIPPWVEGENIKDYVPSVFIDRDFGQDQKKSNAMSRGFGFAEFTHHSHALACLRELNNNPVYSRDYSSGGKAANESKRKGRTVKTKGTSEGKSRLPRLIVDFTVENKIKARKQAERRLHQQLNVAKQRRPGPEEGDRAMAKKNKRNRGAAQREKKRQRGETTDSSPSIQNVPELEHQQGSTVSNSPQAISKARKPPKKKHKIDAKEENLDRLVQSHTANADKNDSQPDPRTRAAKSKRWYE